VIDNVKGKERWVRTPDILAVLTLLFSAVLFFYDIFRGKFLFTERDLAPYFIPARFFWVESIRHGSFPLWNPYQFSGHPFFANPQYGMLYPLNGLFFFFPFDVAFNAIIILHFFLGGLFTYLLLKDLKVNSTGALISGLIFMLSGYLLSVHSLLTILLSSVWTPLIMMFFRRAIESRGFKNEILVAIFITISFFGGGVEIVYGNFFVLLVMAIVSPTLNGAFVGDKPRRSKFLCSVPIYWRRIRSLMIVSILFLLLSAIQFFPFVELFHHSIRGNGISYQEATIWSFAPKDVLLFFLPDAYGYFLDMKKYWISQCWFKTLYTGGLPIILSLIFFIAPHPPLSSSGERIREFGKERKLFFILMFFSIFLSLGRYNPLYPFIFKYVPFFNGIRYPAKFLYIFMLVLSITAGLGFQGLTELSGESENKKYKNLFLVFPLTCGFLLLFLVLGHKEVEHFLKLMGFDFPQANHLTVNLFNAKRFFFYLALFFLLVRVGHEVKWKVWTKVLLILFLTTDLFGNMGFYGKEETSNYFQKTRILEMISSDKGNFRTVSTGKTIAADTPVLVAGANSLTILKEKHHPSMNLLYSLHDVWGVDVIRLRRVDDLYKAFTTTPSIYATQFINLYGVKYIVSVTPLEGNHQLELIYARLEGLQGKRSDLLKENTIKLYRVRNPLPRAWLVKDFKVMDSRAILSTMISKEFHPNTEALLEEEPIQFRNAECKTRNRKFLSLGDGKNPQSEIRNPNSFNRPPNKVEFISESNNRLHLKVRATENLLLVLSDTYYPGWKAFVNGKEVKIYRADYNFRAIPLEAGEHEIKFIYDPVSFKIGAGVSLLAGMGMVVYFLIQYRKGQRRII